MYLKSIARAVPKHALTQVDCLNILQSSGVLSNLKSRSVELIEKILLGNSGIDKRHFAVPDLSLLPSYDAEFLNREFLREAPALAESALNQALEKAYLQSGNLDALFVCTCTGYLCPGISSYVAERMGLNRRAYLQDIVGLGCGASIPTLRSAHNFLREDPDAHVACIAVEICSAAFYLNDDPGVIISLCLFGDGASASIWSGNNSGPGWKTGNFDTLHVPEDRELLRFENKSGKLCNKLHRSVPEKASLAVKKLYDTAFPDSALSNCVIAHGGGRDVIVALQSQIPGHDFRESKSILKQYGNMSSPSVLFALQEALETTDSEKLWLTSFGAGFSAHSLMLSWTGSKI